MRISYVYKQLVVAAYWILYILFIVLLRSEKD